MSTPRERELGEQLASATVAVRVAVSQREELQRDFDTMLAVELQVIRQLRARVDELEAMERCNRLAPGDETVFCDLWPGHDGDHMSARGAEWRAVPSPSGKEHGE